MKHELIPLSELDECYLVTDNEAITSDPLELLIKLEERLIHDYGLTFIQACKLGVETKRKSKH